MEEFFRGIFRQFDERANSGQTLPMNTTVELPVQLVDEAKARAVGDGREASEAVELYLRRGLDIAPDTSGKKLAKPIITQTETGLPLIVGGHAAAPGEELTPNRVAEIIFAEDAEWGL